LIDCEARLAAALTHLLPLTLGSAFSACCGQLRGFMSLEASYHLSYLIYLLVSVAMTIWVARALSRSGLVFLVRCFNQDESLANSTNSLLVIGFYLINLGFIGIRLEQWPMETYNLIALIGPKIGLSILVLGGMHFFNMAMLVRFGRSVGRWMLEKVPEANTVPVATQPASHMQPAFDRPPMGSRTSN
jgi:hypothetical protein